MSRRHLAVLTDLVLILAAILMGLVTNYATGEGRTPFPLRLIQQVAVPALGVLIVVQIVGQVIAYRLAHPSRPAFDWDRRRNPYPGLEAFTEDEAPVFFGREIEIAAVLRRLATFPDDKFHRFVVVIGASGSGKSSLVQAGLIPQLRRRRWIVLPTLEPSSDPLGVLAHSLTVFLGSTNSDQILQRLRDDHAALGAILDHVHRAHRRRFSRVVLVIDQLEELVTLCGARDQDAFLKVLESAIQRDPRFWIIATMRAEFLGELLATTHARLFQQPVAIGTLRSSDLEVVVAHPGAMAGMSFSPGLVDRIVADTGTSDALPLLAFLLQELYLAVGAGRMVTQPDYIAVGGVAGALARQADRVVAESRGSTEVESVLKVLLKFVTTDGTETTRRRVRLADLTTDERRIVQAFVEARLLVTDLDTGIAVAHVAHEALFRQWRHCDRRWKPAWNSCDGAPSWIDGRRTGRAPTATRTIY
jgi:hypothetical protein